MFFGYQFYSSRPTHLMALATKALDVGNVAKAKQLANRLERQGNDSSAHILKGKIFLYQAKEQLEKAPLPFPYEGIQRAGQLVLSGASLGVYPPALRGLAWQEHILVQKAFPRQITGVDNLLSALSEFTQVLDDDPWAAEATVLASECLARLGDYRSAEQAITTLVNRQPDNLEAQRWLAAIYMDVNARIPAAAHLREWIRLDAKDPRPYRKLFLITRDIEQDYPEAIQTYQKLLQLDLDAGERELVLKELAEAIMGAEADYQRALDTLAQGPESFQARPAVQVLRAECLQGLGEEDRAGQIVDGVLKVHPTLASALLFRAQLYLRHDQPGLAVPLMEKLVSLQPTNRQGRLTLMLAYRSIKDDRRAAEQQQYLDRLQAVEERQRELQPLIARDPWNAAARLEMAMLNSSINYSEALAWIRFAFASNPEDPKIRKTWTQLVGYQPPPLLRDFQRRRQEITGASSVLRH
jgi:tetratricopeptide (TPR) repeat protein